MIEGQIEQTEIASSQVLHARSSRLDELLGSLESIPLVNGEKFSNASVSMPVWDNTLRQVMSYSTLAHVSDKRVPHATPQLIYDYPPPPTPPCHTPTPYTAGRSCF